MIRWWVVFAIFVAGCQVDEVKCFNDNDCVEGEVCNQTLGRCVHHYLNQDIGRLDDSLLDTTQDSAVDLVPDSSEMTPDAQFDAMSDIVSPTRDVDVNPDSEPDSDVIRDVSIVEDAEDLRDLELVIDSDSEPDSDVIRDVSIVEDAEDLRDLELVIDSEINPIDSDIDTDSVTPDAEIDAALAFDAELDVEIDADVAFQSDVAVDVMIFPDVDPSATLETLSISSNAAELFVSQTRAFTVEAHYSNGDVADRTAEVIWSSSDEAIAIFSEEAGHEGELLGRAQGEVQVSARLDGVESEPVVVAINLPVQIDCPPGGLVDEAFSFDSVDLSDGEIPFIEYAWDFGDGPVEIAAGDVAMLHAFGAEGEHEVQLTVSTEAVDAIMVSCVVRVVSDHTPVVEIVAPEADREARPGERVFVEVEALASPARTISRVALLVDGLEVSEDLDAPYSFNFEVPQDAEVGGALSLTVLAEDSEGVSVEAGPLVLTVIDDAAPYATFLSFLLEPGVFAVNASGVMDDFTPLEELEVRWDWESDGIWDTEWDVDKTTTHLYEVQEDGRITMEVRDGAGRVSSVGHNIYFDEPVEVEGEVSTTTWSGTVIVRETITVSLGQVLTIDAGTRVLFDTSGHYSINVLGEIQVNGTLEDPVVFTSLLEEGTAGDWRRIRLQGTTDSQISNSIIAFNDQIFLSGDNGSIFSNIEIHNSLNNVFSLSSGINTQLINILINKSEGFGVYAINNADITISGFNIQNMVTGIVLESNQRSNVENIFIKNTSGDAISSLNESGFSLSRVQIFNSLGNGLNIHRSSNSLVENVFAINTQNTGILISDSLGVTLKNLLIKNSILEGISVIGDSSFELHDSQVLNSHAIGIKQDLTDSSEPALLNNVIVRYGDNVGIKLNAGGIINSSSFSDNMGSGVVLLNESLELNLNDVSISRNKNHGVYIESGSINLDFCEIDQNQKHGIHAKGLTSLNISNSNIRQNNFFGMSFTSTSQSYVNSIIFNNNFKNNGVNLEDINEFNETADIDYSLPVYLDIVDGNVTAYATKFTSVLSVSLGNNMFCLTENNGNVSCFNSNGLIPFEFTDETFVRLLAGSYFVCGLKEDFTVSCSGGNFSDENPTPSDFFTNISLGSSHICGLKSNKYILCWGRELDDPFGFVNEQYVDLASGAAHVCGLTEFGEIFCWGNNSNNQLNVPNGIYSHVFASGNSSCGMNLDNEIICWGWGAQRSIAGEFSHFAMGFQYFCGISDSDHTLYCNGSVDVALDENVTSITGSTFSNDICGECSNQNFCCWSGYNGSLRFFGSSDKNYDNFIDIPDMIIGIELRATGLARIFKINEMFNGSSNHIWLTGYPETIEINAQNNYWGSSGNIDDYILSNIVNAIDYSDPILTEIPNIGPRVQPDVP